MAVVFLLRLRLPKLPQVSITYRNAENGGGAAGHKSLPPAAVRLLRREICNLLIGEEISS
jgi:hypothetical protein